MHVNIILYICNNIAENVFCGNIYKKEFGNIMADNTIETGTDKLVPITEDFTEITYDEHFKNVFGIKKVLAVIIKETIEIYSGYSVEEITGFIERIDVSAVNVSPGGKRIISNESHVNNEGTLKYDIIVKVGIPAAIHIKMGYKYAQIKLNTEMQRKFNPGYILSKRGLYYCSRMISDQLPVITKSTNYDQLEPVYSIWITLVSHSDNLANKVLKYKINNMSSKEVDVNSKSVRKMDTVTELLNLYFICIDKDILSKKIIGDGLEAVVEFISLMFAGRFEDKRFKKHGIEFDLMNSKNKKEMEDMAAYFSEVAEERAEAREEGYEEGYGEGYDEGVELMAKLSVKLAEDGRIADIVKVTTDNNYLKQLLKEYGLSE